MSKTKTQSKALALPQVDPRVRMKEVRDAVAAAHKNNQRIDLMGFKGDDIARSQIALQDLLTDEQARHKRARGHIVEQKEILMALAEMIAFMGNHATERLVRDQEKLGRLAQELRATSAQNALLHQQEHALLDENAQLSVDLEAAVNTVRIVLNGNTNG
jgi:hypothetical protein